MLRTLSRVGVPVPRPIEATDRAILMSYLGDEDAAAPQLHRHRARDADEAHDLLDQCLRAIERMLFHDVVHGDLSPFNVLVWEGRIWVIDLPQAVDPKKNRHAEPLLARDVKRITEHFARQGAVRDGEAFAGDLTRGRSPTRSRGAQNRHRSRARRRDPEPRGRGGYSGHAERIATVVMLDVVGRRGRRPTGRQAASSPRFARRPRGDQAPGGREEDNAGDGFFATFPQPDQGSGRDALADEAAFGIESAPDPHRAD